MVFPNGHRTVLIRGEEFKFSCAHFVSYGNFRERLHGHNYTVEVEATGVMSIDDGYVIDFGILKKAIRETCKSLNEKIIIPMRSETVNVRTVYRPTHTTTTESISSCGVGEVDPTTSPTEQLELQCLSSFFSFPKSDCALLNIRFSTAEELSHYFAIQLDEILGQEFRKRGITSVTVRVFERPSQAASFTLRLDDEKSA